MTELAVLEQTNRPFSLIALRGSERLIQTVEPMEPPAPVEEKTAESLLKKEGVYLITNGTSGAGLVLAGSLARSIQARLVLTDNEFFPPYDQWDKWREEHETNDPVSIKISILEAFEIPPAGLMVETVDLTDREAVEKFLARVEARFGAVDGLIHTPLTIQNPHSTSIAQPAQAVFDNAVKGAVVLDSILTEKKSQLPFTLYCSPLSASLETSQAAAFAAGSFFDAFSRARCEDFLNQADDVNELQAPSVPPFFSVHWDAEWAGDDAYTTLFQILQNPAAQVAIPRPGQDYRHIVDHGLIPLLPSASSGKEAGGAETSEDDENSNYVAPRDKAEQMIAQAWEDILGRKPIGVHDNFFEMGGDSLKGISFVNKFKDLLGEIIHITVMFDAPTVAELSAYFKDNYPEGFARMMGETVAEGTGPQAGIITLEKVERIRGIIPDLSELKTIEAPKNRRAVFILSPPRTGSTLFRVILGGHPQLVAPPELNLLEYVTLQERKAENTGHQASHLQGTVRAIMQIENCDADKAEKIMANCEAEGLTVKQFYARLQEWIGDRLLVDKSPGYAMNVETMRRAETYFDDALYIHLLRHPYGMIRSYNEAKLDLLMDRQMRDVLGYSRRELGELSWTISEQNIINFLKEVPSKRQLEVKFEELVVEPERIINSICSFLELDFHPDMLDPYKKKKKRMTDGVHSEGIMLGDMKFHKHNGIDPKVADTWKEVFTEDFLGEPTLQIARSFGYKTIEELNAQKEQEQKTAQEMLDNLDNFSDDQVDDLLAQMMAQQE